MTNTVIVEQGTDHVALPLYGSSPDGQRSAYCFKRVWRIRPFESEEIYIDAQNKERVSTVKGPDQAEEEVEVYARGYGFLGHLIEPRWDDIASHPCVVEEWHNWTGGLTDTPGDAVWVEVRRG